MSAHAARGVSPDNAGLSRVSLLALLGAGVSTFFSGAMIFALPGVLRGTWAAQVTGGDEGPLGWVMTFVVVSLGVFTFFAGKWHMRLGTRKTYAIGTAILVVCCLLLIALPHSLWALYLWGFLNGTGSCFVYGPSLAVVQHYYPHKRGLATGFVNLMFGGSGAVMAPIFGLMIKKLGYVGLNWSLIALLCVFNAFSIAVTQLPDRAGLRPGVLAALKARHESVRNDPNATLGRDAEVKDAVKSAPFRWIWVAWAFMGAAGVSMVTLSTAYGASFASKGLTVEQAAGLGILLLSCYNITNGVSRIIAGAVSDKIGRNTLGCVTFVAAALGYLALPFTTSQVLLAIEVALVGFAFGTLFAITSPLATDLFGLKNFGTIFGSIFTAYGFVGGIIGPLLASYVLAATGSNFTVVFIYLAVFCAIAAAAIMLAKTAGERYLAAQANTGAGQNGE